MQVRGLQTCQSLRVAVWLLSVCLTNPLRQYYYGVMTTTNDVYNERARLVAFLATIYPSHIGYTDPDEPDWPVVIIEAPGGQMSWHVSPDDVHMFDHVEPTNRMCRGWDGHSTQEKYDRLERTLLHEKSAGTLGLLLTRDLGDSRGE